MLRERWRLPPESVAEDPGERRRSFGADLQYLTDLAATLAVLGAVRVDLDVGPPILLKHRAVAGDDAVHAMLVALHDLDFLDECHAADLSMST